MSVKYKKATMPTVVDSIVLIIMSASQPIQIALRDNVNNVNDLNGFNDGIKYTLYIFLCRFFLISFLRNQSFILIF